MIGYCLLGQRKLTFYDVLYLLFPRTFDDLYGLVVQARHREN